MSAFQRTLRICLAGWFLCAAVGCVTEPAPVKPGDNVHGYVGPAMEKDRSEQKAPKAKPVVTEVAPAI